MSNLFEEKSVTGKRNKKEPYNENWEAEIASYDEECQRKEKNFLSKHVIVSGSDNSGLTVEENEVLELFLNGVSCGQIASQYEVEEEVITGLLEVIRAKLSLGDECSN